jgi:hypothetical protein
LFFFDVSLVFTKFTHEQVIRGKQVRSREIRLVQIMSVERSLYFNEKQRKIVEGLQRLKDTAMDIDLAVKLFEEVDADGSGEMHPMSDQCSTIHHDLS